MGPPILWCKALKEEGASGFQTLILWAIFAVVGTANWFLTFCLFIETPLLVASGASGVGGLPESLRLSSYLNVSLVGEWRVSSRAEEELPHTHARLT